MPLRGRILKGVKSIQKSQVMILSFAGFKGQQQFLFFFLVANTNYLFAIFVRHEMSVWLCGSVYTHVFVCVFVNMLVNVRGMSFCVKMDFLWLESRILVY